MTDNSNRYGSEPLGKSVEEVEQESGNLVNSPVGGETVRRDEDVAVVVPAVVNGNTTGVPALINPEGLTDRSGTPADGTTRENRDSSEE
ncbi:hypothetical protein HNQ07_002852 [Deinococcus metalli]|uniref:Uncharacterized protein n=1 Tax=Deinococcus metalli TaxID=1141878 RepID=A0A7W8NQY9_9DEIO|nr:hypothetical protein [Deinococcus metalli]MBB5377360.1 hypothetical protein [Deinococcus metalli]GHF49866.1 hypothetical protein GCM10017781_27860 [Deinococcus metalli]